MKNKINLLLTLFLVCLGLGVTQQAWGWTINNAKIYYDPTAAGWGSGDCTHIQIFIDKGNSSWASGWGNSGMSMSHITNTNLWYWTGSWGDGQVSYLRFATTKSGNWDWEGGKTSWDRLKDNSACCGVDNGAGTDVNNEYKLFTSTSSTKGASITTTSLSGGWGDLNKKQTVKVMISTDGGTNYTEATTDWYSNSISASRYTLTSANTAEQSQKNVSRIDNYASGVLTSSITFTASADDNFTFAGWAEDADGPDDTNASYTYTVSDTKTIYAYFNEKVSTITLVGCTAVSTTAGPITVGTATAQEPAGKEVTGFTSDGGVTGMSAMENKAVTFNATDEGTVTAVFAYKTPTIDVASSASYTLGGAAIKLNPKYSNLAADATYSWTGTNVTFTPSADVANPNVSSTVEGNHTVTVTVSQGGKNASQDITLIVSKFSGDDCGTCFDYEQ